MRISDEQRIRRFNTLADIEKEAILQRLYAFKWNKQAAAKSLGISYKTIFNRMRAHEIPFEPPPEFAHKTYPSKKRNQTLSDPVPLKPRALPMIEFYWVVDGTQYKEYVFPEELVLPTLHHTRHIPAIRMTVTPPIEGYLEVTHVANLLFDSTHPWFRRW